MNLELYYRILKHDPDGRLVKDSGLIPSGSYVIQFLEMISGFLDGEGVTATDVAGAETSLVDASSDMRYHGYIYAAAGNDAQGIVVGTNAGVTAEDNENYALDTKILHSAVGAAGKMNYQAVTFVVPREVGANVDLDVARAFLNETGSTITVKEIGIICKTFPTTKYFLMLRDVVSDEDVLDGYTLTVVYTLRTTV